MVSAVKRLLQTIVSPLNTVENNTVGWLKCNFIASRLPTEDEDFLVSNCTVDGD